MWMVVCTRSPSKVEEGREGGREGNIGDTYVKGNSDAFTGGGGGGREARGDRRYIGKVWGGY